MLPSFFSCFVFSFFFSIRACEMFFSLFPHVFKCLFSSFPCAGRGLPHGQAVALLDFDQRAGLGHLRGGLSFFLSLSILMASYHRMFPLFNPISVRDPRLPYQCCLVCRCSWEWFKPASLLARCHKPKSLLLNGRFSLFLSFSLARSPRCVFFSFILWYTESLKRRLS